MISHPLGQCKKLQKNGCFEDNGDDRGQNSDNGNSIVQVSNVTPQPSPTLETVLEDTPGM